MKSKMTNELWLSKRGKIITNRGGWRIGEAIYNCGYSMMDDLVGKKSFFQTLILNVTRKMPSKVLSDWFEASFICLSWPDSRIWCNQNGSLIGSVKGSPVAGIAAGILSADSRMYGPGSITGGAEFIQQALKWYNEGMTPLEIIEKELATKHTKPGTKPVIVGYARPIATGDERVEAMEKVTKNLGFEEGEHLKLAFRIHTTLAEHYQENMNYVGYVTAFLTDQGFTPTEMYRIYSTWVHSGVHACYAEANDDIAGGFLPLACDDIDYTGIKPRTLPKQE
jgi:citrate synthase